ncbi:50S ribosomal protein L21 [Patescibacteria group bacterium]|nr:50S ribosomal protein L21 [Patescibacteria group bacterium]
MFAIIETAGAQYKVEKGAKIEVNRMEGKEGSSIKIDQVLLIDDNGKVEVGTPTVGAEVTAKILEHKRGEKIVVFKMKAKKRYQKTQGHRQELTVLEITDIKQK